DLNRQPHPTNLNSGEPLSDGGTVPYPSNMTGEISERVMRLLRAEAVLDIAVNLIWNDRRWIDRPGEDLLRFAQKVATSRASTRPDLENEAAAGYAEEADECEPFLAPPTFR